MKVLVSDNLDVILSIKSGLEDSAEYKVIGAESGGKCLELLEVEVPDLILLDIMMPEMSGWETYDEIKENEAWGKIPIVFLTARTDKIARDADIFESNTEIVIIVPVSTPRKIIFIGV